MVLLLQRCAKRLFTFCCGWERPADTAAAKVCGAGAVALICQIEPSNPGKSWCLWLILKYIKVSIAAISEHRDCS